MCDRPSKRRVEDATPKMDTTNMTIKLTMTAFGSSIITNQIRGEWWPARKHVFTLKFLKHLRLCHGWKLIAVMLGLGWWKLITAMLGLGRPTSRKN